MRIRPWAPMPTEWILSGHMAEAFTWTGSGTVKGASAIAALQLWVALATQAEEGVVMHESPAIGAELTYDALMDATGLSRKLVAAGLAGLQASGVVCIQKIGRRCRYYLQGFVPGHWCKLPARALYTGTRIAAFHHFQKRSACELHAMKLYLYYSAIRSREAPYAMASFEKINARTGVPEKRIPRANAFLLNAGLVINIGQENVAGTKRKEPNKYYLAGYKDLFIGATPTSSANV